jgi:hypothetical protein
VKKEKKRKADAEISCNYYFRTITGAEEATYKLVEKKKTVTGRTIVTDDGHGRWSR